MARDGAVDESVRAGRAAAYENPRPDIQALVPRSALRILDLGCASGEVGAALKARQGAEVLGIEVDSAYAEDARARLDAVVEANLEELVGRDDLEAELGRFDCLVAGDVLEHLRDPWRVLRRLVALLDPDGVAVVSLPNVRHWETFWQLGVRGTWPRRGDGIFDFAHLRWFTLYDAIGLLQEAGLEVVELRRQYRLGRHASRWDRYARLLERTPLRPFVAFQYVIAAVRRQP